MKILNGKKLAGDILKQLALEIKKSKLKPRLAVLMAGDDEASKLYVNLKKKAAAKVGIAVDEYMFPASVSEQDLVGKIKELNEDQKVSGIIVQLPLPAVLNEDKIMSAIDPAKDVDGFHPENRKALIKGKAELMPVLPSVILLCLKKAFKDNLAGKKILALVNSEVFGQALAAVLKPENPDFNFMVRNTCLIKGAEKDLKDADAIITVCGCPKMIKEDIIKDKVVLIDGGITRYHDGKVAGDVDAESVKSKAAFLTPVPGGLGPLTVALLLCNVVVAARSQK